MTPTTRRALFIIMMIAIEMSMIKTNMTILHLPLDHLGDNHHDHDHHLHHPVNDGHLALQGGDHRTKSGFCLIVLIMNINNININIININIIVKIIITIMIFLDALASLELGPVTNSIGN